MICQEKFKNQQSRTDSQSQANLELVAAIIRSGAIKKFKYTKHMSIFILNFKHFSA